MKLNGAGDRNREDGEKKCGGIDILEWSGFRYCEEEAPDPEAGKWFCANEIKIFEFRSVVERNARDMGRAWLRAKGLRLPVINTKQSCTGRPSRSD
ncbi:hypothetical protein SLA2020_139810 [Shorea laevis]